MAVKFQKIVRAVVVLLASMLVLSGCQESTTVSEKPAVKTAKNQERKQEKKSEKKDDKKSSEVEKETQEEEEEYIEVEVEEEVQQPSTSNKTSSSSKKAAVTASKPATQKPQNPQNHQETEELTCYFSISCHTILNNMDRLEAGKEVLVPSNGVLYAQREVTFQEGETVFDVLLRETKKNGIHMEYSFTPGLNSNYIEGIANLYELDCGPNSGWMYSVNGVYPDYGCSAYLLEDQDVIEWNYTCDLGRDL